MSRGARCRGWELGGDRARPGEDRERGGACPRLAALWRRPWARATILLTPPLAWFVLLYLAALVVLLITAFWQINPFTTNIERVWSLDNFTTIFTSAAYRGIIVRTVGMAAAVTVTDAVVAFPFAYFMARVAAPQDPDGPVRGDPAAAVGELPGQGVLLAADLHARRAPGLEPRRSASARCT